MALSWAVAAAVLLLAAGRAGAQPPGNLLYPPVVNGQPVKVAISLVITNLPSIEDAKEHFQVNAYIFARWRDPRLAHPPRPDGLPINYEPDAIWHPRPEIVNAVRPRQRQDLALTADPDGTMHYMERFDAEISSKFSLRNFPFDSQTLEIVIHPFANNVQSVVYHPDKRESWASGELEGYSSLAEWQVSTVAPIARVVTLNGREVSEVRFEIRIVRRYQYYLWKVFLPLLLMVVLSWTVFWIEISDLQNQIQISVITLLSVIAFSLAISSSLPKVPYLTFSDAFFLTCYVFVFIAILEVMTVHVLHRRRGRDPGARLRSYSQWLVPLGFCTTVAVMIFRFL